MGKEIMLRNVRISFPQLWEEQVKPDGGTYKRGITIVLNPEQNAQQINLVAKTIVEVAKAEKKFDGVVPKASKLCIQDGERPEYGPDSKIVKASTAVVPVVLHKDMTRATPADDPIYSGCYANVKIQIWAQANQHGRRVNAKLVAIQFAGDGEAWDAGHISEEQAVDGFESLEEQGLDDFSDLGI